MQSSDHSQKFPQATCEYCGWKYFPTANHPIHLCYASLASANQALETWKMECERLRKLVVPPVEILTPVAPQKGEKNMTWNPTAKARSLAYSLLVDIAAEAYLDHPGKVDLLTQGVLAWMVHDACSKERPGKKARKEMKKLRECLESVRRKLMTWTADDVDVTRPELDSLIELIEHETAETTEGDVNP